MQRRAGGEWINVSPPGPCTLEAVNPLEPGASKQATIGIPNDAPPGTYRIWFPYVRPMTDHFIPADLQSTGLFEVATLQPL